MDSNNTPPNRPIQGEPSKSKASLIILLIELGLAVIGINAALGFSDTAIPMVLKQKGLSDTQNSLNFSLYLISFIAGCFLVIPLFKKFPSRTVTFLSIMGIVMSLAALTVTTHIFPIIIWYSIQGMCCAVITIIFSNIITTVSDFIKNKGAFMGFFVASMSLGYYLGIEGFPILNNFHRYNSFLIMTLITIISSIPMICSRDIYELMASGIKEIESSPVNFLSSLKSIYMLPVAFFSIVIGGIDANTFVGLIPLWGLDQGYSAENSALLATPIIMGGIVLTSFFGNFFDYFGYIKTALIYATILIISFFVMHLAGFYFLTNTPIFMGMVLSPSLFIFGGITNAFQSLYLCVLSEQFKGALLTGACAAAVCLGHIAAAIATPMCGYAMTHHGNHRLGLSLIFINGICILFFLFQLWQQKYKHQFPTEITSKTNKK
ncbi:MAG: hypothetical protein A3F67_07280 [Verrucomicrobia bacterium RIFCSPHIGHO2_12_FULL_41_10]|nr:MAG: hypothetical protein A3F67_07280 [Verrucomicrobia bacterium RIFCSPHIGHO2_12_FULL_41_10]HLB33454.1 MFS transporter [Chthoniobacterales bacterium]